MTYTGLRAVMALEALVADLRRVARSGDAWTRAVATRRHAHRGRASAPAAPVSRRSGHDPAATSRERLAVTVLLIILAHLVSLSIGFLAGLLLDLRAQRLEAEDPTAPREPRARFADNGRAYLEPEDDR